MTQRDEVLRMLLEVDEVCGSEFYRRYIARYSVHVHRLRQDGYLISKRPCDIEAHGHVATAWLYRLEAVPAPIGPTERTPVDGQLALPVVASVSRFNDDSRPLEHRRTDTMTALAARPHRSVDVQTGGLL